MLRVNTVTLFYMKSYSEKWVGSNIKVSVFVRNSTGTTPLATVELTGFHEKRTSEYFTAKLSFERGVENKDETVLLLLEMKGGKTFKIGGLAFCAETVS